MEARNRFVHEILRYDRSELKHLVWVGARVLEEVLRFNQQCFQFGPFCGRYAFKSYELGRCSDVVKDFECARCESLNGNRVLFVEPQPYSRIKLALDYIGLGKIKTTRKIGHLLSLFHSFPVVLPFRLALLNLRARNRHNATGQLPETLERCFVRLWLGLLWHDLILTQRSQSAI